IDFETTNDGLIFYLSTFSSGNSTTIVKTDFAGNILWRKQYPFYTSACTNCYNSKINKSSDGGYLVVSGANGAWGGMFKIDSTGNVLFSLSLMLSATDVIESADHGYFILGNGPLIGVLAP